MKKELRRSIISGKASAKPSTAMACRAVIAATLAPVQSVVSNVAFSYDLNTVIDACRSLGADIQTGEGVIDVMGLEELFPPGKLDCKKSAAALKLLMPVSLLFKGKTTFKFSDMSPQTVANHANYLSSLSSETPGATAGISPAGIVLSGPISKSPIIYPASLGSALASGISLFAPLLETGLDIGIEGNMASQGIFDSTVKLMQDCGIVLSYVEGPLLSIEGGQAYSPPDEFVVPNSMCEPSYYAIAGALCGKAEIIGMADSPAFIRLLDDFGVSYSIDDGTLRVSASQLESADIEVENHADFILQTMVLGAASVGKTTISGLPALSGTAKRRVAILSRELVRMGAKITIGESGMEIEGGWLTGGVETDPSGDPHVAMALSIASLAARTPSVVTDIDCIGKAHPNFLRDLANMGAIIREAADMGPQVGAPKKL